MNIDIINYGHFRVTDYGRGKYQLFNRNNDKVTDINHRAFKAIKEHKSIEACKFVEDAHGNIE
jgi:TPP-dependent trihydroxycyclohexane-1,2-dione (THcHDO) dehydratase